MRRGRQRHKRNTSIFWFILSVDFNEIQFLKSNPLNFEASIKKKARGKFKGIGAMRRGRQRHKRNTSIFWFILSVDFNEIQLLKSNPLNFEASIKKRKILRH